MKGCTVISKEIIEKVLPCRMSKRRRHADKPMTTAESINLDFCHAIRDNNLIETCATVERILTDGCHAVTEDDLLQI